MKKSFLSVLFLQCKTSVGLFIRRDLCVFPAFRDFYANSPILGWKRGSAGLWSEALQAEDIALCLCVFVQCLLCSIAAMRRQPILPSLPPFLPPASAPLSLVFNQIIFPICVSYSHPFIRNPNHIPSPRSPFQLSISSPDLSSISLQLAI